MNTFIPGPLPDQARNLLRKAGYGEHRGYEAQMSYTRRLQNTMFPRYHAYVEDKNGGMQLNLHLDQKEASHGGGHAHSGEYNGPLVERENARIVSAIRAMGQEQPTAEPSQDQPSSKSKGGFFGWLFG